MDVILAGVRTALRPPLQLALEEVGLSTEWVPWGKAEKAAKVVVADLRDRPHRADDVAAWRAGGLTAKVLVLAEPGESHLHALEAGADDYLLSPFGPAQVATRVVALLRRASNRARATLQLRDGTVNLDTREVTRNGEVLRLTATEARLTRFLARYPGVSFSREQLQVQVWGYRPGVRSRTVFTTVQRLRVKLEVDPKTPVHLITDAQGRYRLTSAAPPAPSATVQMHPATSFVGRGDEIDALAALVVGSKGAMVTVVGQGGIGKTHLATELAARLGPDFRDGAVLVELAAVEDEGSVVPTILDALGVERGTEMLATLVDALQERDMLLVLDNLEHLPGMPDLLTTILTSSPNAAIVATSRVPMRLQRESVFPLDGLPVDEAVELFQQTASRSRAGWKPAEGDAERMRAIVGRVGGAPLGVVLAASWARTLTVANIAQELERGLELLDEGPRDLPERHRSARAAFEGSWALLASDQRAVLAALSVFRTPFDRNAAAAVAGASLTDLLRLVDASLVRRSGELYDLHPLLAEFAKAKRLESGTSETVDARHTAWFAGELRKWNRQLQSLERDDEDVGRELDAVRADVWHVWLRAAERLDVELLLAAQGPMFRGLEGTPAALDLMAPVLRSLGPAHDDEPPAIRAVRAQALGMQAVGRVHSGDDDAMVDIDAALALLEGLQAPEADLVRAQVMLARHVVRLYASAGHPEEMEEEVQAHQAVGDLRAELLARATMLYFLGVEGRAEDVDRLRPEVMAHPLLRGRNRGRCLMYAAMAEVELGRWERALEGIVDAQETLLSARDAFFASWAAALRAHLEARLGSPIALVTARDALDDALALRLQEDIGIAILAAVAHAWARGIQPPPDAEERAVRIAARCQTMCVIRSVKQIGQAALDLIEPRVEPEAFARWVVAGQTLDVTDTMQCVLAELSGG